ncbi:hypothetical protein F183_A11270 [Bryobacterales bacterium F-183]|nr:hypothetical protein F183_A11270 [Bryobacterales bacterium F-183]
MKASVFYLLSLSALCALPSKADIAVDYLSNGYISGFGTSVGTLTSILGRDLRVGLEFRPAKDGKVSQIDLAVWHLPDISPDNSFTVSIWSGSMAYPEIQLGSWDYNSTLNTNVCCGYDSIFPTNGPLLKAGEAYYLVVNARGTTLGGWAGTNISGVQFISINGGSWQVNGFEALAARVYTTSVPEGSGAAVCCLLLGTAVLIRSRRVRAATGMIGS